MAEEESKKQERSIHQPEIQKGYDAEKSGFEKGHIQERGNLSEGYQPIRDVTTTPPGGGSGVPDKNDND